ncbi:MAG: hypothetical protein H0V17_09080 [Deltaproteobacteria bacterium]|nr:hypothetical protein [Deltaproteobacteria bacterium]
MSRTWIVAFVLACAGCGKKETAPSSTAGSTTPGATATGSAAVVEDIRSRCTRLVDKTMKLGIGEKESTREQKIDFCVGEPPPSATFFDCVDKATTKEAAEACT